MLHQAITELLSQVAHFTPVRWFDLLPLKGGKKLKLTDLVVESGCAFQPDAKPLLC